MMGHGVDCQLCTLDTSPDRRMSFTLHTCLTRYSTTCNREKCKRIFTGVFRTQNRLQDASVAGTVTSYNKHSCRRETARRFD